MNYYDRNTFNIEEIEGTSDGVKLAKRYLLALKISVLYSVAYLIFFIFVIKPRVSFLLVEDNMVYVMLFASALFLFIAIISGVGLVMRKQISGLDIQEKIYYDLYMYNTIGLRLKNWGFFIALAMARLEAIKGDKEMCQNAMALIHKKGKSRNYQAIQSWLKEGEGPIDVSLLETSKSRLPVSTLILFLVLAEAAVYNTFDRYMLLAYGIPESILTFQELVVALAMAVFYTGALYILLLRKQERSIKIIITAIIFVILLMLSVFINCDAITNAISYSDTQDESSDYYYDDYSYEDEYDYSTDDDYYIDDSSEPVNDVDIMNYMITLANYLLDNQVIEDFKEVKLSYTAKGRVCGTIDRDDSYEYNLYDNGTKNDENGNECIELVLEAEPLDEEGNSLGQPEASLKGFYLVNLETYEVIDEHKTHW